MSKDRRLRLAEAVRPAYTSATLPRAFTIKGMCELSMEQLNSFVFSKLLPRAIPRLLCERLSGYLSCETLMSHAFRTLPTQQNHANVNQSLCLVSSKEDPRLVQISWCEGVYCRSDSYNRAAKKAPRPKIPAETALTLAAEPPLLLLAAAEPDGVPVPPLPPVVC